MRLTITIICLYTWVHVVTLKDCAFQEYTEYAVELSMGRTDNFFFLHRRCEYKTDLYPDTSTMKTTN